MEKINRSQSRVQQADRLCCRKTKKRLSPRKGAKKGLKGRLNQSRLNQSRLETKSLN